VMDFRRHYSILKSFRAGHARTGLKYGIPEDRKKYSTFRVEYVVLFLEPWESENECALLDVGCPGIVWADDRL